MYTTILFILCFMIFCLPTVLPKHSQLRYYSCYVSFVSTTLTTALFLYPLQILLPSGAHRFPVMMTELVSKVIGIEWDTRNKYIIDKCKNAVIVINHQSMLDLLATITAFKPLTKYIIVLKKELEHVFPFGQTMKLFNATFVDRKNNACRANGLLKEKLMDKDKSLIIYPEGTRNHNGEPFLPFKKGAFRVAVESKRPILPVVISPYYFIKSGRFTGGKVIISFLEPIDTVQLHEGDIDGLVDRTRELMGEEYRKLKTEISNSAFFTPCT